MSYKKLVFIFGVFVLIGCLNAHKVGHTVGSITGGEVIFIVCALVGLNLNTANLDLFVKIIGS
ncbi:MAG: inorganic phosphate transporter, PiT family [Methanothermococcus sp.]|nr:inorganic phosphate transporter, PiT family [Methanothermococcus sp.]